MSIKFLKVKIKSLAEEARIIRLEEQRAKGQLRNELRNHRVTVVRPAQRVAHLAYAFLRGKRCFAVDQSVHRDGPVQALARIEARKLIRKYGAGHAIMSLSKEEGDRVIDSWFKETGAGSAGSQEISTSTVEQCNSAPALQIHTTKVTGSPMPFLGSALRALRLGMLR